MFSFWAPGLTTVWQSWVEACFTVLWLSTSYRRGRWFESHLGNTFFSIRWIYIYLTWRENNIPQSQAFDSIYILPASFPLLVVPHAVITLETNRCYLEALCLYKIYFFEWLELWKKSIQPLEWWNDATIPPGHFRNILILNNLCAVTWLDGRVVKAQCCRQDNVGSILDSTMCVYIFFKYFFFWIYYTSFIFYLLVWLIDWLIWLFVCLSVCLCVCLFVLSHLSCKCSEFNT